MSEQTAFVEHQFAEHMEATAQTAGELSNAIVSAAELLVEVLLGDGKLMAVGNGNANVLAQYFCTCLANRLDHERPSLPAINLGADATTYAAICRDNRFNDTFSRQVRALGKDNDLLVAFVDEGHKANMIQAIQAAHDRGMRVMVISASERSDITSLLAPEDFELALNNLPAKRALEIMMVISNTLCSLIDQQLFGV